MWRLRCRSPAFGGLSRRVAHRWQSSQAEVRGKHVPIGEAGSGYYSDHTKGCYDVVDKATPMMLEACRSALAQRQQRKAMESAEPFVICDYGCADAGTSLPMMRKLVRMVREAEPSTPIVLVYEDQPQNDWSSVFNRISGDIPSVGGFGEATLEKGITEEHENVSVFATGVSFYQRNLPEGFADLMFSATAMHWLKTVPKPMPDLLHSCMAEPGSPEDLEYEAAALDDWKCILEHRAHELKPGGVFGVVSFSKTPEGYFLGRSSHVKESMHAHFLDIWRSFAQTGLITNDEFVATNFPMRYRSLEEYLAPFGGDVAPSADADFPVVGATAGGLSTSGRFEGLRVVGAVYGEVRCPYHVRWMNEGDQSSAEAKKAHAEHYVPTTRTWSNSTFEMGLSRSRTPEDRAAIVERLFQAYTDVVAARPGENCMDYEHVYMAIQKE